MALVNPNIAMSFKPTTEYQPRNVLAEYAQVQQIMGGQTQQEAARMQLDKMKRDEEALGTMMQRITAKGGPSDPVEAATAMIQSGIPHFMDVGLKMQQTVRDNQDARAAMGLPPLPTYGAPQPTNALAPTPAAPAAPVNAMAPTPAPAPAAPVNAMAAPAAGGMSMEEQRARTMLLSPNAGVREAGKVELARLTTPQVVAPGGTLLVGGKPVFTAPERQDTDLIREYNVAKKEGFPGSLFDYKRQIALAGRAPAQPAQPSAPVAVVDPVTGKQVLVSREEALRGRMTPAAAMESLPPKEIQKREAAFPQATAAVKGFESKSEQYIKELEKLRDDPGLDQITGPVYGRTPSVSREGSRAQSLYDKVFAKGGFQALQDMREASKTGGALGNVSNEEGRRLEKSVVGGLDRTQNITDVKQGINDLIDEIRGSQARVRDTYDTTYSYKAGAPAANVTTNPKFPGFSIGKP